jgi:hypothetical protein
VKNEWNDPLYDDPFRSNKEIVGIAWYQEDQWDLLVEVADDPEKLHDSYEEWRKDATQAILRMQDDGLNVFPFPVDVNKIVAWCKANGLPMDRSNCAKYVTMKLQESDGKIFDD